MCGIAGIVDRARRIEPGILTAMLSPMRYRGPDESGIYLDDFAGLGHLRLSIVGLKGGAQPIHNEDRSLWIVFNGEIYNHVELRAKLEDRGHRFYTKTDTEVILHQYEESGASCVDNFNGQFAFALWDSRRRELFLARDRVGVRPLLYAVHDNRFLFASEAKALFAAGVPAQIDERGLDQVFTLWTTLPGRTVFKGVRELLPGHTAIVGQDMELRESKYWSVPCVPSEDRTTDSPEEIAERIRELLTDAVRLRLRADVPVGAYLSGGLDSSGLTSLVVKKFDADVRTFGIRFEEAAFDEGDYQREMVEYLGVNNHQEITATNQLIAQSFPAVVRHAEKPLLRTGPVPLYLLSRLVRDSGLKVVLTGEGADEFFGGYDIFREAMVRQFWARRPESPVRASLVEHLHPDIFRSPIAKKTLSLFYRKSLDNPMSPFFSHTVRWDTTRRTKAFFSNELRSQLNGYDCVEELRASLPDSFDRLDSLTKAQYLETNIFLSNYLLSSQGDRVAMAHSVEIRFPYLDHRLIEYMGTVPSLWKILGINEKHILKKAFAGILPKRILARNKHPYRAPIQQALFCPGAAGLRETCLSDAAVRNAGLFDSDKTRLLCKKIESGSVLGEADGMAIAGILSSHIIHEACGKGFWSEGAGHMEHAVFEDLRAVTGNSTISQ